MRQVMSFSRMCAVALAMLATFAVTTSASAAGTSCLPASIKSKLSQIRAKFGPVSIISTYRKGARIAGSGKRSHHANCRAVDFHAPKGKYRQVVAWLKSTHSGGVGTYSCGMHHIHIDNGGRVRFHKCVNSRGARIGRKGKKRYAYKGKRNRKYSGKSSKKRYANSKRRKSYKKKTYASKKRSYKKKKYVAKKKTIRVARVPSPGGKITAYSH